MRLSNLFSLSYWFDASVLDRPAGPAMWLVVAAGVMWLLAGIVAVWRIRRVPRDMALAQVVAGLLIAAVAIGRLYAVPVLGLRVGWLLAGLVAVTPVVPRLLAQAYRDGLFGDCLRAMAFSPVQKSAAWHPATMLAWLGLHAAGLAAVISVVRLPLLLAPLLMALLLAPMAIASLAGFNHEGTKARGSLNLLRVFAPSWFSFISRGLSAFTPLLLVYAVLALRLLVGFIARFAMGEFRVVEPFGALLNLSLVLIVMSVYALASSIYLAATAQSSSVVRHPSSVKYGSLALIAGVIAWAGWTALTLRTHGASGSDPYAYVQMGVDLADHGTVFHSFPLARLTYDLNIPTEPVVHIGYKLPQDVSRMATTVWPPGYAVFTAAAYKLLGETGLYLITPILSLVSLLAVGWMTLTLTRSPAPLRGRGTRLAVAALVIFLTATSYQQVEWQLIPMADVAAQLFSVLALAIAFSSQRSALSGQLPVPTRRPPVSYAHAALAGVCLGIAFSIRYTQVLIAPALALALVLPADDGRRMTTDDRSGPSSVFRLPSILVCALFALLAAAPVLMYHTVAFGSPLHTGSEEWSNFSLARLPETAWRIASELNAYREYGLLTPFMAVGMYALWRRARRASWVLLAYFAPLFVFHVAYWPLRLRDILPLFPVLSLLAALGVVWLVQRLIELSHEDTTTRSTLKEHRAFVSSWLSNAGLAGLLVILSFAFVLRSMDTLALPVTRGFGAFGYMVREQRASFSQIARLTPEGAAIACSLNSGAIDLYAARLTFRPANWMPAQLLAFVRALQAEGTPVYVLEDGAEVASAVRTLREQFTLNEVARLDVPYYFAGSGSENRKVPLFRVEKVEGS